MKKILSCCLLNGLLMLYQPAFADSRGISEASLQLSSAVISEQGELSSQTQEKPLDEQLSGEGLLAMDNENVSAVTATAPFSGTHAMSDLSPWGMYLAADWVVKLVMILLLLASLVTWTICIYKGVQLSLARRTIRRILNVVAVASDFSSAKLQTEAALNCQLADKTNGNHADSEQRVSASSGGEVGLIMVQATALELQLSGFDADPDGLKERIAARLERVQVSAITKINRGTGILATIGSVAPFVGLFGTVWGIMNSFIGIAESQTTNLAVVAPGIAEALLATAVGLVAAIPAVVVYNHFARVIGVYRVGLGDVATALLILVSRDLDSRLQIGEAELESRGQNSGV